MKMKKKIHRVLQWDETSNTKVESEIQREKKIM